MLRKQMSPLGRAWWIMRRLLAAVIVLAAIDSAWAGDRETIQAAMDGACGSALPPKARQRCESCFVKHWPKASACAKRCKKGDPDCMTVCRFDFDMDIGACTLQPEK
jgi:hypothetical protein